MQLFSVKVGKQIHWGWGSGFHRQVNRSGHPALVTFRKQVVLDRPNSNDPTLPVWPFRPIRALAYLALKDEALAINPNLKPQRGQRYCSPSGLLILSLGENKFSIYNNVLNLACKRVLDVASITLVIDKLCSKQ